MKKTINEVLKEKNVGLFYGKRILLPFVADVLKVVIDKFIYMDFNLPKSSIVYSKHDYYTEINFTELEDLRDLVSKYELIKMVVVEEGKNIFDFANHKKIELKILEKHKLSIEELDEDVIFLE